MAQQYTDLISALEGRLTTLEGLPTNSKELAAVNQALTVEQLKAQADKLAAEALAAANALAAAEAAAKAAADAAAAAATPAA